MFVGHLGVGLALKKADARINLGWLFFGVLFADVLLWLLVLAGMEKVIVPPDYPQTHFLHFIFPYSHGLASTVIWSVAALIITWIVTKRNSAAIVMAAAVFSHFILDYIVHTSELPLLGNSSQMIGMGLWKNMYAALVLELLLLIAGFYIYIDTTAPKNKTGRYGLPVFLALVTVFAFTGQLLAPVPPGSIPLAGSSLAVLLVVFVVSGWLDKKRKHVIHDF